jgi:YkoY family integral membrane protein
MYGQTFGQHDLATIALLIVLEGVLSIDNALVLALLAKRLPKALQSRALTYGLVGAFAFRFIAIAGASYLLKWEIVKLIGGGYLVWVALQHLLSKSKDEQPDHIAVDAENNPTLVDDATGKEINAEECEEEVRVRTVLPLPAGGTAGFWPTVLVIEMTDIAFAIDSILAAIAVVGSAPAGHVGPHPKLWVVMTGGMLGVVLMRVAATVFIRLLERFPRFETSAYLLVFVIGCKLLVDWLFNSAENPHRVDFHDTTSLAFWTFWLIMALCIAFGFLPSRAKGARTETHA